jgi:prolyl 4-hydroxylase
MLNKNVTLERQTETDWFVNRLFPHEINLDTKTHVAAWYTSELSIIDEVSDVFTSELSKGMGNSGMFGRGVVDKERKDSTDLCLNDYPEIADKYFNKILDPALQAYMQLYPWCNNVDRFGVVETANLQEYAPGSNGYAIWHCESTGWQNNHRHLVFMTYLNDVHDGGETEFWTQQLKIKPEKGLTVIFPSAWTHHHRGRSSPSEYKRFVTGWFSFYPEDMTKSNLLEDAQREKLGEILKNP